MKAKFIFNLILSILISSNIFSQGNIVYSLQVVDNYDKPLTNISISAFETTTFKIVNGLTNIEGKIQLELNNGREWVLSVGEIKKCINISAVQFNTVEMNEIYIYDLEGYSRKKEQDINRTNKDFEIILQSNNRETAFNEPNCMLIIKMKHPNGSILKNINVDIVNVKDSIIYRSQTNDKGESYFILPNKNKYDIDINEFKNYTFSDFGEEYVERPLTIEFAPTNVNEQLKNDTIYQYVLKTDLPSSSRAHIKINVSGGKRNGNNETIFLRQLKTGKVFSAKSNSDGSAYFLVPNNHIYMVDFNYQKDVDAVNLMNAKPMTRGEISVYYSPDPRLEYPERFIPTSNNLLIKNFNSFLIKQFEKPKDKPFFLNISSAKKINKSSKEALFLLTLSGSETYGKGIRLPLNIAFVLDKSGSMYCCERTESLKKSLWDIGNSIAKDDIISFVLFDDEAVSVMRAKKNYLDCFQVIINNYSPNGGTNIFKGLQVGVEDVLKDFDANKSNRIILLTDGYGITPPKEITDYVELKNKEGIEFSAIGLGNDYNQSLLELIARNGNGTFNNVDNSVDLSSVFLKEVKNAFYYIAKDLKVEVFYDEKLIFTNLYGYPVTDNSKNMISFEIGKITSNTNQIAFLKFKIDNPSLELESKPLTIKVSYYDLVQNKKISYEEKIKLNWTEETKTELLLDQEEKELYSIAILNQSLKVMAEAYERNNISAAKEALENGINQIEDIFPNAKPKDVKNLFEEVDKYVKLFNQMDKNKDK